ncbi:unnamed protein product [Arctogadus glacialis]
MGVPVGAMGSPIPLKGALGAGEQRVLRVTEGLGWEDSAEETGEVRPEEIYGVSACEGPGDSLAGGGGSEMDFTIRSTLVHPHDYIVVRSFPNNLGFRGSPSQTSPPHTSLRGRP